MSVRKRWRIALVAVIAVGVLWLTARQRSGGGTTVVPDRGAASTERESPAAVSLPGTEARGEVVLGVVAPMTGGKADQGEQFVEGVQLAVEALNARGGLLGHPVKTLFLDDRGEPNEAAAAAQRLVATPGVVGIVGLSSTASASAAAPILERARIPTISPSASTRRLVTDNRCFYLMTLPLEAYAPRVARTAVEEFGAERLALIHVQDDWGEGATEEVERWARRTGVPIVAEASFTQGTRFFKAQLTSLLARRPDALLLNTHYVEGALITRQARDLGYDGPIVAQGTVVYPKYLELAGDASEGVVSWVSFLPTLPSPSVQRAVARFRAEYGRDPRQYSINAYDAVGILAAAFERVGSLGKLSEVCTELGRTRHYQGVAGLLSYNGERLPEKDLFWVVARNGAWRLFKERELP